jgi:hypothetical protein
MYDELADLYGDGYASALRLLVETTGAETPPAGEVGFGISLEQVNERSVAWAREHAAEQVTAIRENTREMLRATVTQSIEEGWGAIRLGEEIADSAGFSDARAEMIGRTETIAAENRGNREAYEDVEEQLPGTVFGVEWLTAGDDLVSEECQENEDVGPIGLDDVFPSGDDSPPLHPTCRCALLPVLEPIDE